MDSLPLVFLFFLRSLTTWYGIQSTDTEYTSILLGDAWKHRRVIR